MRILFLTGVGVFCGLSAMLLACTSQESEFQERTVCSYDNVAIVRTAPPFVPSAGGTSPVEIAKEMYIKSLLSQRAGLVQRASCAKTCETVQIPSGAQCVVNLDCENIGGDFRGRRCSPEGVCVVREYSISAESPTSSPAAETRTYSTTNNQVAGVEEADILKNDATHIYAISELGTVKIVEAWPAESSRVVATLRPDGTARKLLLVGDRLVVFSSIRRRIAGVDFTYNPKECTYGYDCEVRGDGAKTLVEIYDIRVRSAPTLVHSYETSASLLRARSVGPLVHTVVFDEAERLLNEQQANRIYQLASEQLQKLSYSEPFRASPECIDDEVVFNNEVQRFDKILADRLEAADKVLREVAPAQNDTVRYFREEGAPLQANVRAGTVQDGTQLSVLSFDVGTPGAHVEGLAATAGFVYATARALYVAGSSYQGNQTQVYKFALGSTPSETRYEARGTVKGRPLNQFALDEWNGHLRIATTSGRAPAPTAHSTVTVLSQTGEKLVQNGIADNIAPTEDIRSVRFDGDRAFLVTFKRTDPLFSLDLSNPAAPRVAGELKIPGFSTYLHFMDRDHLLAMGLESDGRNFDGIQLQMFDVANLAEPKLMHKTVIGNRGTTSDALTNHLAFNYSPEKNMLALPMTVCEDGEVGRYGDRMTFSGLYVYNVTKDSGFSWLGGISHMPKNPIEGCDTSWPAENTTEVKRSIFIGDYVYSVGRDHIRVAPVTNLSSRPVAYVGLSD